MRHSFEPNYRKGYGFFYLLENLEIHMAKH